MREVTLGVRHTGEPECETSARYPDVTLRSVSSMTGRGTKRKRINELRGPPARIEAFLEEFERADSVVRVEPLSPLGADRVFVSIVVDAETWDGITDRLAELGIHYRMGTIINAGVERWTVYLDDDDDLGEVIRSLERGGNDVEIRRNVGLDEIDRPPQLEMTRFLDDLTERQRDVLSTAIEMGYYNHGRSVGIEAVADRLDLGSTTVWEHLSRAESKVMDGVGPHVGRE